MQQIPLCKRANLGEYSKNMELLSQVFDGRLTLSKDNIKLKLTKDPFSADPE
jgi:hypothetical protein